MMHKIVAGLALMLALTCGAAGCGKISGPRFWWDDRTQTRLPDDYQLPEDVAASAALDTESARPADEGEAFPDGDVPPERRVVASGEDLTDQNLQDYRTNLDLEEEKRKSEAALFDF